MPIDSIIVVCRDDVLIEARRNLLCKYSHYFDRLLNGSFLESQQTVVKLNKFDGDFVQRIFNFYSKFYDRSIVDLKPEVNFCKIFMRNHEECWNIIEICDMLGFYEALMECDKYMQQTMYLTCLSITCALAETFSRFNITKHAVYLHISKENKQNSKCEYCRINTKTMNNAQECDMRCYLQLYSAANVIYAIGGNHWEPVVECYKTDEDNLNDTKFELENEGSVDQIPKKCTNYETVTSFPSPHLEEYRVTSLGACIYVTGGFHDLTMKAKFDVWKYDTDIDEWSQVSPMRYKRFYHCSFGVNEMLYVCGGYDDDKVLQSLEVYRHDYNEWVDLQDMPIGVGNAAYTSYKNDILFVVCGQYGVKDIQTTNAVQEYNVHMNQWNILTTYASPVFFPYSEYGLSCAILDDKMFVIGGQSVRVDEYNFKTKEWKRICDMKRRRMEAAVCVINNKLTVAGGYDYQCGTHHDSMEVLDREENTWNILQQTLPRSVRSFGLCNVMKITRNKTT